jgi:transposase
VSGLAKKVRTFSVEYKDEAVKLVVAGNRTVPQAAKELGLNQSTLRNWVDAYRAKNPTEEEPLTLSERARLRELERENRELKMKNEFLGKAAAFFAQEYR